jgi:hypothetical protein
MTTRYCSLLTSADMNATGYNILLTVLFIIYIFAHCVRSHSVMNFVFVMNSVSVRFLLLFFRIKLLIKMANFPTDSRFTIPCNGADPNKRRGL